MKLSEFLDEYGHDPNPQAADDFGAVDVGKVRGRRARAATEKATGALFGGAQQYALSPGGDAVLKFGKYRGKKVSDLANDAEGRRYLQEFVLAGEFPVALKRLIRGRL